MLGFLLGDMFHIIDNDSGFETTVFTRNIREIGRRKFVAVVIIEETNTKRNKSSEKGRPMVGSFT